MASASPHDPSYSEITARLFELATGYMPAACLHAVARLRIADLLSSGPASVTELARRAGGVKEDALHRMLRALASVGVFAEIEPRVFVNTPSSELLSAEVRGSVRDIALWLANPLHLRVFAETLHAGETGAPAIQKVTGHDAFDYFRHNPAESEIFNAAMTGFSAQYTPSVLEAYDFSGAGTLADIGGGHGYLLTAILRKHYGLRGILCDMPHVAAGAKAHIESYGLESRCTIAAGNFFEGVPAADTYVMKSIVHDWDDAHAVTILKNCAAAMCRPHGKVILLELVLHPGNEPDMGKWIDLEMLLMSGGRERTEAEFAALLAQAGLRLARVVRTRSPMCVIESVKE